MTELPPELSETIDSETCDNAFDVVPVGLAYVDMLGYWRRVNHYTCELLGRTEQELQQLTYKDVTHPEDHEQDVREVRSLLEGETNCCRYEKRYLRKDNTVKWARISFREITGSKSGEQLFLVSLEDITEEKKRQKELVTQVDASNEANQAKSDFLANMSHEIRTPLSGVLGFADLLLAEAEDLGPERMEYVNAIKSSGQHLLGLINNILDLAKIESGKLELEQDECDIHTLLSESVSILRVQALEKGITLDYRWENAKVSDLLTDSHRLRQILFNLIGNAIKFTERGGVTVIANFKEDESKLEISIRDTGVGINKVDLERIFAPFSQADNSVTRRFGGTGLGLTISRRLVEILGGDLHVQSTPNVGSEFTLVFEATRAASSHLEDPRQDLHFGEVDQRSSKSGSSHELCKHFLVADDGEINRRLISLILKRAGATTVCVENGQEAVQALQEQSFDAVIMDMQMPVLDGYLATKKIRENGHKLPIVALTANAMVGDRTRCLSAGCSHYASKPIEADELVRVLRSCFRDESPRLSTDDGEAKIKNLCDTLSKEWTQLIDQNDDEILELAKQFWNKLQVEMRLMKSLAACNEERAIDQVSTKLHWLKGSAGMIGFSSISVESERIKNRLNEKNLETVHLEISRTLAAIQACQAVPVAAP